MSRLHFSTDVLRAQVLNYHPSAKGPTQNPNVDNNQKTGGFQARLLTIWTAHEKAIGRKLPQREVAKAVGASQRAMSALLQIEGRLPSAKVLQGLATYFGVGQDWLLSGEGEVTPVEALNTQETELLLLYRALSRSGKTYILGRTQEIFQDEHEKTGPQSPSPRSPTTDDPRDPSNFN
jgi:transcriptional regulator with XRE-family HTH domain